MQKGMTIVYGVKSGLYVNLTNRCPCACTFCIRKNADKVYEEPDTLWLEHEPSFSEVRSAFEAQDMSRYTEVVFCGYGEPTEALDVMLETAAFVKEHYKIPVRLNTNGLGNLINGKRIEPLLEGLVDTVSVSLNTSDVENYLRVVRPGFGAESFESMLDFARECKKYVPNVVMTTVDTTITHEDEKRCAEICRGLGVSYRIREYSAPDEGDSSKGTVSENKSTLKETDAVVETETGTGKKTRSQLTTLCYIEKGDSYLMLHRVSKKNDINHDKWIGVGGHFERDESPEDCLLREVKEETGLTLNGYRFRGIVTFISDGSEAEYMCLYTSDDFSGTLIDCDEGKLEWIKKADFMKLEHWEGDAIFLKLIEEDAPFFSLKLVYTNGRLVESVLNGRKL